MFPQNYSIGMVISALVTMAVLLAVVRLYLFVVNRKSSINKPDWMSEEEFANRFGKRKKND